MSNKIRIKRPKLKLNPSVLSELTTLLQQSIGKTEALVKANEDLRNENKELNDEVSRTLEDFDTRIKALEEKSPS